jgi:hypothetical protein
VLVNDCLHSIGQNHFYVMMLLNRDDVISKVYTSVLCFKKTLYRIQDNVVQRPLHPSWRSSIMHHPSRRELSIRTPFCVQKLRTVPGCICPDISATRPDTFQCLTSKRISFPNTYMGRQLQPSGIRGFFVQTLSLIRKVTQKTFNRPDSQTLLWKLRVVEVQPFGC